MGAGELGIEDEEDPPPDPPSADRVARRALVLTAIARRSHLESEPGGEALLRPLQSWWRGLDLGAEEEPEERALIATPFGGLSSKVRKRGTWHIEGASVLAWALRCTELPPYDRQCEPSFVASGLGLMEDRPAALMAPRLRDSDELHWFADLMFSVHWRLVEFSLHRAPMDFARFAETAYFGPLELEGVTLVDHDLAIDGVPIGVSTRWEEVWGIVGERHQAANWLVGQHPLYSEVTADT